MLPNVHGSNPKKHPHNPTRILDYRHKAAAEVNDIAVLRWQGLMERTQTHRNLHTDTHSANAWTRKCAEKQMTVNCDSTQKGPKLAMCTSYTCLFRHQELFRDPDIASIWMHPNSFLWENANKEMLTLPVSINMIKKPTMAEV